MLRRLLEAKYTKASAKFGTQLKIWFIPKRHTFNSRTKTKCLDFFYVIKYSYFWKWEGSSKSISPYCGWFYFSILLAPCYFKFDNFFPPCFFSEVWTLQFSSARFHLKIIQTRQNSKYVSSMLDVRSLKRKCLLKSLFSESNLLIVTINWAPKVCSVSSQPWQWGFNEPFGTTAKQHSHTSRDPTRDGWIKEFIKRKWSSGLFWAVGAAENKNFQLP